jgi:hypothetical protein
VRRERLQIRTKMMAPEDYCVKTMRLVDRFEANTARIQMEVEKSSLKQTSPLPGFPARSSPWLNSHERLCLAHSLYQPVQHVNC